MTQCSSLTLINSSLLLLLSSPPPSRASGSWAASTQTVFLNKLPSFLEKGCDLWKTKELGSLQGKGDEMK